ncbi:hypothetical protein MuYL_1396 [Mucilaginibacter xinganensis]|uniref:Uncharacterized protein n=1 Tax=Mucilaginibacter xinganensis TaxID=1234841 RepID=A0A223NUE0_9SPHI|nr:hypothetical protein MuYL_1396 [Mucilaginibacter xinganensis]
MRQVVLGKSLKLVGKGLRLFTSAGCFNFFVASVYPFVLFASPAPLNLISHI